MRIDVVTLFPEMVDARGAVRRHRARARSAGCGRCGAWNPRDFATDNHRTVDDRPYGGGPGMVMLAEPLAQALAAARAAQRAAGVRGDADDPPVAGRAAADARARGGARGGARRRGMVLLAGRYEGIDERLLEREVDEEIAIGDFVVSGGELPALMLIDAIVRQLPGALNDAESAAQDSFAAGLLDCPHYTRPETYDGERVPDVLLSGTTRRSARWRLKQALGRTWQRRPDLLRGRALTKEEAELLAEYRRDEAIGRTGSRQQ